jgi:hypothetical protein
MAITLDEFFIWQKVYAQSSSCSTASTQEISNQYNSFYNTCMINNNKEEFKCYKDNQKKDIQDTQDCKNIDSASLTKALCKNTNDLVRKNISNLTQKEKDLVTIKQGTWWCACPNGYVIDATTNNPISTCLKNTAGDLWISCDPTQLINGTCSRNINKTLGIRSSDTTPSPTILLQDLVLAATSFVGTVIMIALVVMGIRYIQWWFDESSTGDLKNNIKKLLIWLLLVIGSYTIIRLIQYVARGY